MIHIKGLKAGKLQELYFNTPTIHKAYLKDDRSKFWSVLVILEIAVLEMLGSPELDFQRNAGGYLGVISLTPIDRIRFFFVKNNFKLNANLQKIITWRGIIKVRLRFNHFLLQSSFFYETKGDQDGIVHNGKCYHQSSPSEEKWIELFFRTIQWQSI
jgi:hypothetical protein